MRYEHVRSEVLKMINTDWEARARKVEDEREKRGEPRHAMVQQHILERIFARGNGRWVDVHGEVMKLLPPWYQRKESVHD